MREDNKDILIKSKSISEKLEVRFMKTYWNGKWAYALRIWRFSAREDKWLPTTKGISLAKEYAKPFFKYLILEHERKEREQVD